MKESVCLKSFIALLLLRATRIGIDPIHYYHWQSAPAVAEDNYCALIAGYSNSRFRGIQISGWAGGGWTQIQWLRDGDGGWQWMQTGRLRGERGNGCRFNGSTFYVMFAELVAIQKSAPPSVGFCSS